jgi:D-hexose-6-phosphate mutarotase
MQTIQTLNKQFLTDHHIAFHQLDDGIILVKIDNAFATATISLYGGQVVEWHPKSQATPVLWCSELTQFKPGKAIRAGVPICWPWFGAHPTENKSPSHGYARISEWELISVSTTPSGSTVLCMTMLDSEHSQSHFTIGASLAIRISIGEQLSIELTTTNTGNKTITLTEALHAYFYVGDIVQIKINGLSECGYIDLIDGNTLKTQTGAIQFCEELGRVYIDSTVDCLVEDSDLNRTITIAKTGSQSTVVWNPWLDTATTMDDLGPSGWRTMVCVESANALKNTVRVDAGEQHSLCVTYSVTNH